MDIKLKGFPVPCYVWQFSVYFYFYFYYLVLIKKIANKEFITIYAKTTKNLIVF